MLTVLLKILGILGIILLVLLGILLTLILVILFCPIAYRVNGERKLAEPDSTFRLRVRVRASWLLGFLRVRFAYPEPGNLTAKILCFTVFDSSGEQQAKPERKKRRGKKKRTQREKREEKSGRREKQETREASTTAEEKEQSAKQAAASSPEENGAALTEPQACSDEGNSGTNAAEDADSEESLFRKIKCTIRKICDKIKKIREDIAFYRELLLCDDTRGLVDHAFQRLGRILRSIRPRKLSADILFGTGSPDTTGYALGVYGMLSPHLGKKVNITPDFTQAILAGEIHAAGHITIFRLLWHVVLILLDKRLWRLTKKFKSRDEAAESENDRKGKA